MTTEKTHKWQILFVTCCSSMLTYLDMSAIPVAIPQMEKDLGLSLVGGLWVVNIYLLTLFSFFLISGKLADHYGKKVVFIAGLTIFGLGSILAGLSNSSTWLITSRALQGLGGALSFPTTTAIWVEAFPVTDRAKVTGINTGVGSLFLLAGPAIGGFLVQYFNWRYIFWVNIPFVIYGVVASLCILQNKKPKESQFHLLGAILVMLASICLVTPIMQGVEWGWSSSKVIGLFSLFLIFTALFIYVSLNKKHQLIDFSLFKKFDFNLINVCIFIAQGVLTFNVFIAIYLQKQWSFTPFDAGQLLLIGSIPFVICSPIGGYLSDHLNPHLPTVGGFVILILAFVWFFVFQQEGDYFYFLPPLLALSAAVALIRPGAFSSALKNIPENHLGAAVSVIKTNRQLAGTFGLALMTAVLHSSYQSHSNFQGFFSLVWLLIGVSVLGLALSLLFVYQSKNEPKT